MRDDPSHKNFSLNLKLIQHFKNKQIYFIWNFLKLNSFTIILKWTNQTDELSYNINSDDSLLSITKRKFNSVNHPELSFADILQIMQHCVRMRLNATWIFFEFFWSFLWAWPSALNTMFREFSVAFLNFFPLFFILLLFSLTITLRVFLFYLFFFYVNYFFLSFVSRFGCVL